MDLTFNKIVQFRDGPAACFITDYAEFHSDGSSSNTVTFRTSSLTQRIANLRKRGDDVTQELVGLDALSEAIGDA